MAWEERYNIAEVRKNVKAIRQVKANIVLVFLIKF